MKQTNVYIRNLRGPQSFPESGCKKFPLDKRHIIILVRGDIKFCSYASKVVVNKIDSVLTEA